MTMNCVHWATPRPSAFRSTLIGGLAGFFLGYLFTSTSTFFNVPQIRGIDKSSQGCSYRTMVQGQNVTGSDMQNAIASLQKEESRLIAALVNEIRLLCWVMSDPNRTEHQKAIVETWGRRCDLTLFMVGAKEMLAVDKQQLSKAGANTIPTIPPKSRRQIASNIFYVYLDMGPDTYQNLWAKTRHAFAYIHDHFRTAYDWVFKVDVDSFVIVENLRLFLRDKKAEDPFYYGCSYEHLAPRGYTSGGPGYVMSRYTADKFVALLRSTTDSSCSMDRKTTEAEDVMVGRCLDILGIGPGKTPDADGRFRFSPFNPENTISHKTLPQKVNWFWGFSTYKLKDGFECCSDTFISFHYITPTMMRVYVYFTYYVHPFGSRELWKYNISDMKSMNVE